MARQCCCADRISSSGREVRGGKGAACLEDHSKRSIANHLLVRKLNLPVLRVRERYQCSFPRARTWCLCDKQRVAGSRSAQLQDVCARSRLAPTAYRRGLYGHDFVAAPDRPRQGTPERTAGLCNNGCNPGAAPRHIAHSSVGCSTRRPCRATHTCTCAQVGAQSTHLVPALHAASGQIRAGAVGWPTGALTE